MTAGRATVTRRRLAALALALAMPLAGCGFEPLYGQRTQEAVGDQLAAVQITPIPNRSGQILRNSLVVSLRPNGAAPRQRYLLDVSLVEPRQETAIGRDDLPTRVIYTVIANYRLRDINSGALVHQGVATATSSFNIDSSEFGTISGERAARDQVLGVIGDDITRQLALYFSRRAGA